MTASSPSEGRPPRRAIRSTLLRAGLNIVVLVALYFLLPLNGDGALTVLVLTAGLLVFVGLAAWQVRAILQSGYPVLRAVEALSLSIPMFLVLFAATYYLMSEHDPGSFNVPLTRIDGLYFVIVVFTTVGFGDIVPTSQVARVVVTVQMIGDLLVLGVLLQTVVMAVRISRRRSAEGRSADGSSPDGSSTEPTSTPATGDPDPSN